MIVDLSPEAALRDYGIEPGPRPFAVLADREASIGTRTGLDLRWGTPPPQLAAPFVSSEGVTVIYGPGGVGKGMLACYLVRGLTLAGHVVMCVDFEHHEFEWGSRLRGLGLTDDQLGRFHYRTPFGDDWTAPTGSLFQVASLLRADAERIAATVMVIDSYSVATSSGDAMGGQAAAQEFFVGCGRIGLPTLALAHVAGGGERWPSKPFGSVFVHNLARETWAVESVGPSEPDRELFAPHVIELELRNQKMNGRPKTPPQFVTFSFYGDGSIDAIDAAPATRSLADLAAAVLEQPMTLAEIAAAIKEDTGKVVAVEVLRSALDRAPRRFTKAATGRPRKWSVR